MKFGFGLVPKGALAESIDLVQRAEALGFDMAWVPDQTFFRDPFLVIAEWARATSSIEFMIGVTNPYTRHPAQVARAVATLDEITGGRLNLGIGAGNRRELLLPMGHEQTAAAARCREMAVLVRALLRGEMVHHRSEYVIADGIELQWTPSRADVPIHIAGRGGLTLQAAGEVADGAIVGALVSPAGLDYAFDAIRSGAEKAGRSVEDVRVISWVTCVVTDDVAAVEDRLKASVAHIIGGAPVSLLTAIGMDESYVSALKATYAEGGSAAASRHVTEREIDMLMIVGNADAVTEKAKRLAARGVEQIGVLLTGPTIDDNLATLERISRDIIARFR